MQTNEGYFIISNNGSHFDILTEKLIQSIRKFDSCRPICLLTDNKESTLKNKCDYIIEYDKEKYIDKYHLKNKFEMFGAIPKLKTPEYTPFDTTLLIDNDCYFLNNPELLWNIYKNYNQPLGCIGECDENNSGPSGWHWGTLKEVEKSCGFNIPQIGGGVIYLVKDKLKDFTITIDPYLLNYEKFKIKRWLKDSSHTDEIYFSIYLGIKNIKPLNSEKYKIHQPRWSPKDKMDFSYILCHNMYEKNSEFTIQ